MPKSESPRIDALEALLAERRKHEGYLAKLEERRAGTPDHVYTRLRDEYATKLTDLQVRAAAEAEQIAGSIAGDEAAVHEIETRLASVTEERLEGELRAEVGEYEAKEWSKKLTVLNATIAQLEKERDARVGSFERTRTLLEEALRLPGGGSASAPSAAPPAPPAARASGAVARPDETAPISEGPSAAARAAAARPVPSGSGAPPMAGGPSFDELAFLNSVVGRASAPVAASGVTAPTRPPTPSRGQPGAATVPPAPAAPPAANDSTATAREPNEPTSAPTAEPSSAPTREPATAPRVSAAIPRPAEPAAPPPLPEDEPPSPLGRPTPRTSQAIKTLKCQECGTLNYPTEWYCERCGGELAAL